jgi:hypothetical protein
MAVEITRLGVRGYRQFRDTTLDFVDPKTGKPLEKICFIGGNGTGKSSLLKILYALFDAQFRIRDASRKALALMELAHNDKRWLVYGREIRPRSLNEKFLPFDQLWSTGSERDARIDSQALIVTSEMATELREQLVIYCPPDSEQRPVLGELSDVPNAQLDRALTRIDAPERKQIVGQATVGAFWSDLIAAIKQRESKLLSAHKLEQNRDRTIREVEDQFVRENPEILHELSLFWDSILSKAGLRFDFEGASVPIQLRDNLKAYVRLAGSNQMIPYYALSTGIRNFIFKLGHIFAVFRGREERKGTLLIDEPENSLYPDFLFDLVDYYKRAAPGAQLFMATHSPIIAAQFRPEERFILEFSETEGISVRHGVTPEGDDPNDVLMRDFAVRTLYGPRGLEKWKRFRELDHLIQKESDTVLRRRLLKEYMDLGKAYNFSPDEVSA